MHTLSNNLILQSSSQAPRLTPLPWKIIHIEAKQCKQFLQGQLSCDMELLSHKQSSLGCYCDQKGRMQCSFFIWPNETSGYNMLLHNSLVNDTLALLQKYGIFSQVKLNVDRNTKALGLTIDSTIQLVGIEFINNKKWEPNSIVNHQNITFIRYPDNNQQRYLIIGEQTAIDRFAQHHGCQYDTIHQWLKNDINLGLVHLEKQTQNQLTPPMLNYGQFNGFSLNKGCYLGQEIIARTVRLGKLKRHLHIIKSQQTLYIGQAITRDTTNIGLILSVSIEQNKQNDKNNKYLALAIINDKDLNNLRKNPKQHNPLIQLD